MPSPAIAISRIASPLLADTRNCIGKHLAKRRPDDISMESIRLRRCSIGALLVRLNREVYCTRAISMRTFGAVRCSHLPAHFISEAGRRRTISAPFSSLRIPYELPPGMDRSVDGIIRATARLGKGRPCPRKSSARSGRVDGWRGRTDRTASQHRAWAHPRARAS